ncbi:hypothetical protein V6N13_061742 [Hibiscus sabdariffa]|uniref:Uncharacterized protein n=1 Tax=Hibiscus sabdariffa TaxID=183260 RepID=A0ABR2BF24_9ROSI
MGGRFVITHIRGRDYDSPLRTIKVILEEPISPIYHFKVSEPPPLDKKEMELQRHPRRTSKTVILGQSIEQFSYSRTCLEEGKWKNDSGSGKEPTNDQRPNKQLEIACMRSTTRQKLPMAPC